MRQLWREGLPRDAKQVLKSLGSGTRCCLEGRGHKRELVREGKVSASEVDREGTCQEAEAGDTERSLAPTANERTGQRAGVGLVLGRRWELGEVWIIMMPGCFGRKGKASCSRQLIMVFLK